MDPRDLFLAPELTEEQVAELLGRFGFQDPRTADRHWQQIAELAVDRRRLAGQAPLLLEEMSRAADPDAALVHFRSFLEAVPSAGNLLSVFEENPATVETLMQMMGASPFLVQILIRNPEYFYWLTSGSRLEGAEPADYFRRQAEEAVRPFPQADQKLDALRRLRRREQLRIAAQDLLRRVPFEQTVSQISDLADGLLEAVHAILATALVPGSPGLAVLALGKLGGRELNFSSDVDLLYIYADDCDRDRMLRLAREYTRALSAFTPQGHLYRVDLRLRPMGRQGAIAYSESACRNYYQTWADTMDRLALLKVRAVAGDRQLGERFVHSTQDFVFKKYLDMAALEEIRWTKRRTDDELARSRQSHRNIKLGVGGIREIEFFVQAFQLLYGGSQPDLRTAGTLPALDRLRDHGFIGPDDYSALRRAYLFLRDLEHKLQLVHELQTHSLPQEPGARLLVARRMGYGREGADPTAVREAFERDLQGHHSAVRRIFDSLFAEGATTGGLEELALNPALAREEAVDRLRSQGIRAPDSFWEGLHLLLEVPAFPHSPSRMRNLLANLIPRFAAVENRLDEPRLLFSRLDRFCEALGAREPLYSEMAANPEFARQLLEVLASGEFLAETLIQRPELLDTLASHDPAAPPAEALHRLLDPVRGEPGAGREVLRRFKQREEFKIAAASLLDPAALSARDQLSRLAEACLAGACRLALEALPDFQQERFALLALGKLGGRELIFHSDLDLIFVYDDRNSKRRPPEFSDFLLLLRDQLQAYTETGKAYSLDFRLRPEGRHGTISVPLSAFEHYTEERVAPWERLAYVKMRPVLIQDCFIPDQLLFPRLTFSADERRELHRIRLRKEKERGREQSGSHYDFKVGCGGLLDIQFVVQFLQVQHGLPEPNTLAALERLKQEGVLSASSAEILQLGLSFLFQLEATQGLLDPVSGDRLSGDPERSRRLALWLDFPSSRELLEQYRQITAALRSEYEKVFNVQNSTTETQKHRKKIEKR